jgi:hypothetical protein
MGEKEKPYATPKGVPMMPRASSVHGASGAGVSIMKSKSKESLLRALRALKDAYRLVDEGQDALKDLADHKDAVARVGEIRRRILVEIEGISRKLGA